MDLGLSGRACAVTGASRGIGLATARALAAEGARVLLVARDAAALERAAQSCRRAAGESGGDARRLVLDVTTPDAGERLLAAVDAEFGRLDGLVNGAGHAAARPLEDLADEDWRAQWEIHVMAPLRLMRAAAPRMAEAGWGRIVNVCSSSGKRPSGSLDAAYSVTKAAQLSLSRVFSDAWAGRGVLVNAVAPGPVEGELWLAPGGLADQVAARQGTTREEALEATRKRLPLGRFVTEDEVAAAIAFLCSERAGSVAGAAWAVDAGAVPTIF